VPDAAATAVERSLVTPRNRGKLLQVLGVSFGVAVNAVHAACH
jgi:hypothetical protein